MVTPDDRSVIYISLVGGTVSIWMVPIGGGTPTKLADGGSASCRLTADRWHSPTAGNRSSSSALFPGARRGEPSVPRHSTRRSAGLLTGAASRTRRKEISGCSHSAAAPASAHALRRPPSNWVLRVVEGRQAPGHHPIDGDQRHRPSADIPNPRAGLSPGRAARRGTPVPGWPSTQQGPAWPPRR